MMRALIALSVCAAATGFGGAPAAALPAWPDRQAIAAPAAAALTAVRYRHHDRRRRHYSDNSGPTAAATGSDGGPIKSGQWDFATRLQSPAPAAGAAPLQAPSGGLQNTYSACITAENPVPAALAPGCTLGGIRRDGERVTWSMTCTNRLGPVRSQGVAQYSGDTMAATLISRLPRGGNAKAGADATVELTQHITGHYLGTCPNTMQAAQAALIPPRAQTANAAPQWVEPPAGAATGSAVSVKPATAAATAAAVQPAGGSTPAASAQQPPTTATSERQETSTSEKTAAENAVRDEDQHRYRGRHGRYVRRWGQHRHRRYWARAGYGGYSSLFGYSGYGTPGFGPRPGP